MLRYQGPVAFEACIRAYTFPSSSLHPATTMQFSKHFFGTALSLSLLAILVTRTTTAAVSIAFEDDSLARPSRGTTGVNGLGILEDQLWYTNTGLETMYRVKIGQDGYVKAGEKPA